MFKGQRRGRYIPAKLQALREIPGVRAFVTEVEVRSAPPWWVTASSAEELRSRKAHAAQRVLVPTVWLVLRPMTTFHGPTSSRMFACCASSRPTPPLEIRCHRCHLTSRAIAQFENACRLPGRPQLTRCSINGVAPAAR